MVATLVLDSKTAIHGAQDGLTLCIQTLIPSLFPLIFTTSLLLPRIAPHQNDISRLLCKLFRIPAGSQGLLLTGLLGGYPVGARCVGQAANDGQLSDQTAGRMLVFCNASGPAFIFGIGCNLFQHSWMPWVLWAIHILSCLLTARMLCGKNSEVGSCRAPSAVAVPEALRRSIRAMAEISGWVILLRVLISILDKWCLWLFPPCIRVLCIGLLELSNGCLSLSELSGEGLCFVLYAGFLGFGGLCVALQSFSSSQTVSTRLYFPGKLLQGSISILLAGLLQPLLFSSDSQTVILMAMAALLIPICLFWVQKAEKRGGILHSVGV